MAKKTTKKKTEKKPPRKKGQSVRISDGAAGGAIWEKLKNPFSLPDCKRLVALAVEHNNVMSKIAGNREGLKALRDDWKSGGNASEQSATAKKILSTEDEQDELKARQKACVNDMLKLLIESVGGTLFTDQSDEGADKVGGEKDDPDAPRLSFNGEPVNPEN